jgi:hypothetical protein
MSGCALPNNVVLKVILANYLIEHNLNIVAGVPIAVIIKTACFLEDARQLNASWAHKLNVCLR